MLAAIFLWAAVAAPRQASDYVPAEVLCVRVVDGDTVVVERDGVRAAVRLVGVDTPETVHPRVAPQPFGKEASDYLKKRLTGRMVRLVRDSAAGPADRFNRELAYVFLGGECLNETLVREGYGRAYVKYPQEPAMRARFAIVEAEARAAGRGLWSAEKPRE